jgi:glycosyltransferase involved in cell wall biosynthesis
MHVGYICNEYPGISSNGGIGSFTKSLGDYLVSRGHSVTVFGVYKNLTKKTFTGIDGVQVIAIPYINVPKFHWEYNRWRLMKLIQKEHQKNHLSILESPDYQGWLRTMSIDIPSIMRMHNSAKIGLELDLNISQLPRSIKSEEESVNHANYLCAVSKSVAYASRHTYIEAIREESEIKIIYNGVDTDYYSPDQKNKKNQVNQVKVVYVGRISEKKGVIELIKAWIKVVSVFPNSELILAGKDSNYNKQKSTIEVLKKILPESIKNTVRFKGFLKSEKIKKLFNDSDICVFPSHREALGLVVLEAMAMEKPVVCSRIGSFYEIIEDGINGVLCNQNDVDDISNQIIKLLSDRDLQTSIGQNARRTVLDNFSLEKTSEENIQYYKECIKGYSLIDKNIEYSQ